jgi:predicted TIM-barrel fold metal-dependent hydrolase
MARMGIISVDGHSKASWADYRGYLDPQWRERYDEWVKPVAAVPDFCHTGLGQEAQWDARRRVADLEAQGVVAEVVFPNGATPFASNDPIGRDPEAVRAGYRAHNRWLADLCSVVPGRIFPQALVDFGDVEAAVKEIHAAKAAGFVGVVMPPLVQGAPDSRYFFDPALDPIWAACVETGLPLSQHGGTGAPSYKPMGMAAFLVLATEHSFFSGRSLWQLILGGVFDRFPELKVAYVETEAWWLRPVMELLDRRDLFGDDWAKASGRGGSRPYGRLPSDYLRTNIYMGISPFVKSIALETFDDGKDREIITTANAMIGADYPHPETALFELREAVDQFAALPNVTRDGAQKVIFGNAARLYGIDLGRLQPEVDRVGFELAPAA